MIGRKQNNGPQGDGINKDVSFTLNTVDKHAVCYTEMQGFDGYNQECTYDKSKTLTSQRVDVSNIPLVYRICSYDSNSMKSDNPNSGIYEAQTTRTLDLNGGNPACNQGGMMVVEPLCIENHGTDSRCKINENGIVETLTSRMGTGGNNVPLVGEPIGFSMQSFGEYKENNVVSTISRRDYKNGRDLVCEYKCYQNNSFGGYTDGVGTLKASGGDYGGVSENLCVEKNIKYIVRRLTPKECQRLQGMPENWTCLHQITDMPEEEYEFWKQAHKTYCEVNKKKYKEKSKEQMIKWYNELQKDAAEYKAYGNGMALPCVRVPIHGIAKQGVKTMASLFDGIGGFPLAGLLDEIECLWTSEIELFPIAVTKERFL